MKVVVRAPGRANLIGEHTDYNDGFVLPIAIGLATTIEGRRGGNRISLVSDARDSSVGFELDDVVISEQGWGRYVVGVVRALRDAGVGVSGFEGRISSDVPVGAGLSSSAALEVALALALMEEELSPVEVAQICRRAENVYVGVASGIMDQLTSAAARPEHACLIDCRQNSIEYVPLPAGMKALLIDSGVVRDLAASSFNERVEECRSAAAGLGLDSLRDANLDEVESLDEPLRSRARHVVQENERTRAAAEAFARQDLDEIGRLFRESHLSYSADFDASTPEIDRLVALAQATDGVAGARLTGGGWGGCTVNLLNPGADAERVAHHIASSYLSDTGIVPRWWLTEASGGAERLS